MDTQQELPQQPQPRRQKRRYFPFKAIVPRAFQGAMYICVALLAIGLAFLQPDSTDLDRYLSIGLMAGALLYVSAQGWWWLRTYYVVQADGLLVSKVGKREWIPWESIQSAQYDSAACTIGIVLEDHVVDLIEYNDLRTLIQELDLRGIRLEYHRFKQ